MGKHLEQALAFCVCPPVPKEDNKNNIRCSHRYNTTCKCKVSFFLNPVIVRAMKSDKLLLSLCYLSPLNIIIFLHLHVFGISQFHTYCP